MPVATLTSKGQVTIPREVRRALRIEAGDRIAFEVTSEGTVTVRPQTTSLLALAGTLVPRRRGVSLSDMDRAIRSGGTRR
jgi:AbrB family looped-hinge helix DNA binding protein